MSKQADSMSGRARRLLRRPARFVRRALLPRVLPDVSDRPMPQGAGVRVVGLLSSASGIGKSARLCAETLQRDGYPVQGRDLAGLFAAGDDIPFPGAARIRPRPRISIIHLNPPMLLPGVIRSGLISHYRSYTIGYWAWELEDLPREWIEAIRFVNAVMVPSVFCQQAVQRHTSKPVLVVPHPVARLPENPRNHEGRTFRVVNVFRFGSSFERKNPIALVKAFRAAFGSDPDARLILKTSDGARFPADMARLQRVATGMSNVEIVDEIWEEARVASLIRSADLYASLHRSEGFGLPLAEAIMAGTPVLATNWSGSTDFCAPEHTFTVDYVLVPFADSHPDYEQVAGARWADPSVEHAAFQMQRARDDRAAARAKAREARRALCGHLEAHSYARALAVLGGSVVPAEMPKIERPRDRAAAG